MLHHQMNVHCTSLAGNTALTLILKNEAHLILNMQNLFMIVGISIHTSGNWYKSSYRIYLLRHLLVCICAEVAPRDHTNPRVPWYEVHSHHGPCTNSHLPGVPRCQLQASSHAEVLSQSTAALPKVCSTYHLDATMLGIRVPQYFLWILPLNT